MKKKSSSKIANIFSRIFNIRWWADWDRVNSFTQYLLNGIKHLFVPMKTADVEAFDKAQKRLHISDEELLIKQKALFRLCVIMLCVASLIFMYAGYHLFYGTFRAAIISYVVMMIALVLAFRYHFWYFQIKNRQLGCTIQEWWKKGIRGENK